MNHKEFKKQLLKSEEFRKLYFKKDLKLEVAKILIKGRIWRNMTQDDLASKIGTKQPSIARVENGSYLPSLTFLEKIADALGAFIEIGLKYWEDVELDYKSNAGICEVALANKLVAPNSLINSYTYSDLNTRSTTADTIAIVNKFKRSILI